MKLKYIIAAAFLALAGMNANAQTMYDAFRFSDNNYYGTARSIAMGNAFTALGGDLGSIGINPAGSSVNSYSQFTLTPNVSILCTAAGYNSNPAQNSMFENSISRNKSRFSIPNFGFTTTFKTGNRSGIKSFTVGFVGNATANYLDGILAYGRNDQTTMLGSLATGASADGIPSDKLNSNAWDAGYNWRNMVAYQSGMIATIDDAKVNYIGATEKLYQNDNGDSEIMLGGPLDQTYGKVSYGNKYDMQVNFGMNISDMIYLGANLGLISINYESDSYFREEAVNPKDFQNEFENGVKINFNNAEFGDYYLANASGVYGKFGIIALPVNGLRLGLAIQTPTMTAITEHWQYRGETHFSDRKFDAKATSDYGVYDYRLISPYRVNFGAAYTSRYGLISVDYELSDYSQMRFKEQGTNINSQFDLVNRLNNRFFGFQHNLRIGAELRLPYNFSVRAGYNLTTSPERFWRDKEGIVDAGVYESMYFDNKISDSEFRSWEESLGGMEYVQANTQSFSFGLGYQTKRSFFFDIACRGTMRPATYIYPYDNYLDDGIASPEIRVKSTLWDVVATFGWRF